MSPGIRATVEFDDPEVCPLASLSTRESATIRSVSTSVSTADAPASVSEFRLATEAPVDDERVSRVASDGSTDVYRLDHGGSDSCPCACLGRYGCPVDRYVAEDGRLTLVFHAADFGELQTLVAALRERFPDVDIRRLIRDPDEGPATDEVAVDRARLTDRQFEVLRTAYEMGYFERPKRANATDVTAELGVNRATFSEHLGAAQRKLLADLFE